MNKVLFYNHADPDESFVTELTEEELKLAKEQGTEMSQELYDLARSREIKMPSICYYA